MARYMHTGYTGPSCAYQDDDWQEHRDSDEHEEDAGTHECRKVCELRRRRHAAQQAHMYLQLQPYLGYLLDQKLLVGRGERHKLLEVNS